MSAMTGFLVLVAVATGLAAGTVLLIRRPLGVLLVELCGSQDRARFWAVYSSVILVLATLTGMLLFPPAPDSNLWNTFPDMRDAFPMFRAGVIGLLAALAGLAGVLLLAIGFHAENAAKTGKI
jgi:hypothetical protein